MSLHPSLSFKNNSTFIEIFVRPRSPRLKIILEDEAIIIHVTKPADKGKANREIISFFSKLLNISSSSVAIVSGLKNQNKVLQITSLDTKTVFEKIKEKAEK
ncbi:MAG: DUF167 domain-containing protein [Candidatus Heimdallarchaeaceae archaeon]